MYLTACIILLLEYIPTYFINEDLCRSSECVKFTLIIMIKWSVCGRYQKHVYIYIYTVFEFRSCVSYVVRMVNAIIKLSNLILKIRILSVRRKPTYSMKLKEINIDICPRMYTYVQIAKICRVC